MTVCWGNGEEKGGGGHAAKAGGKWLVLFPEMDGGSLDIFGFVGVIETEGKS